MVKQRRRIRNGAQRLRRETYVLQRRLLSDRVGRLSVRKLEEDRSCLVGASCEFRLGARSSESQRCPPSRAIRKVDGDRRSRSLQFAHFRGEGNQPSLSGLTSPSRIIANEMTAAAIARTAPIKEAWMSPFRNADL